MNKQDSDHWYSDQTCGLRPDGDCAQGWIESFQLSRSPPRYTKPKKIKRRIRCSTTVKTKLQQRDILFALRI